MIQGVTSAYQRGPLDCNARGWLLPSDDFLRLFLSLPELAPEPESCEAELELHARLLGAPATPVNDALLEQFADADTAANYRMFLAFRDALLAAGSLESYYLGLMRSQRITVPPLFIDCVVQTIVGHLLAGTDDAYQARAAEVLYRPQRLTRAEGRLLCADQELLDRQHESAGLLDVLTPDNAADYWRSSERSLFALDLTHTLSNDLGHGLSFQLTRKHSGLTALALVLERWVTHFLDVRVTITPLQKIDDPAWRWHIGLDVESMSLLNDLYEDRPVTAERSERLISLFRLDFVAADPQGKYAKPAQSPQSVKPVYLGLAMTADHTLRLKPQNLLLNLPLAMAP